MSLLDLAPVVPVVVIQDLETAVPAARALVSGGLPVIEVTLRTDCALEAIGRIRAEVPQAVVGAGTVRTPADARAAVAAGASFLVSPELDLDVVRYAVERDLAVVPGCLTPTEMATAQRAGAHAVKIFPAHLWTPAALAGTLEAMPDLRCVPTGGVTPGSAPDWVRAGAVAVGVGGSLTRADDVHGTVARLLAAIRDARA